MTSISPVLSTIGSTAQPISNDAGPNNETILGFDFIYLLGEGNRVFVTYEAWNKSRKRFRNSEILTVRDGQLVDAEVYFGWNVPHEAAAGGSVSPE